MSIALVRGMQIRIDGSWKNQINRNLMGMNAEIDRILLILLFILIWGLSGCGLEVDRQTSNLVELVTVECLIKGKKWNSRETHAPDLLIRMRNHSEDTVGILAYASEVQFSIPGTPPLKKPCKCTGTKHGFTIFKDSTILDLSPTAEDDFFIIGPKSDKSMFFITRSSNVPFSSLTKEKIIDILCTGSIQYKSPCNSVSSSYFPEGVKWVKGINIR